MGKDFFKHPAFWTAVAGVITAVGQGFVTGQWSTAVTAALSAIATLFLTKQNVAQAEELKAIKRA